jgi:aspartate kinase
MRTLVMKFGGASVATPQHFSHLAEIIAARKSDDLRIVVVVSAMGGMTDQLLALCREVHDDPPRREQDMLISVGERISSALLSMALHKRGIEAISFTGSQSGIITCSRHSEARILDVKPFRILRHLDEGKVVIVAGFQGVSREGEITTLGRGGSDTTAVALAVALGAERVEFYKDVDGVYSEDPKRSAQAEHFKTLSYDAAISIVAKGAKVLHLRCVELAKKNMIPLHILSFKKSSTNAFMGTIISEEKKMQDELKIYEVSDVNC